MTADRVLVILYFPLSFPILFYFYSIIIKKVTLQRFTTIICITDVLLKTNPDHFYIFSKQT